jgi:hypothetical protein
MKKILLYKLYSFLAIVHYILKIKLHGLLQLIFLFSPVTVTEPSRLPEIHISYESVWQLPIESTTSDGIRRLFGLNSIHSRQQCAYKYCFKKL